MDMERVQDVIRQEMRRIREEHAVVLRDVARAATDVGISWEPSAVSRIETGHRDLTLEEFAKLPLILTVACNEVVTLADLLPFDPGAEVTLEGIPIMDFIWLLAEPHVTAYEPDAAVGAAVRKQLDKEKRDVQVARAPADDAADRYELRTLTAELGVPEWEVRGALLNLSIRQGLWSSPSLRHERERRLRESAEDLANPNHVKTVRGNITRQLKQELRDEIAAMKEAGSGEHQQGSGRVARPVEDAQRR